MTAGSPQIAPISSIICAVMRYASAFSCLTASGFFCLPPVNSRRFTSKSASTLSTVTVLRPSARSMPCSVSASSIAE